MVLIINNFTISCPQHASARYNAVMGRNAGSLENFSVSAKEEGRELIARKKVYIHDKLLLIRSPMNE